MGYDVSWHPITEEQIQKWYFDVLEKSALADKLKVRVPADQLEHESQREEFESFYLDKYKTTLKTVMNMEGSFSRTHAYCIAVTQGSFEEFFYTRGAALSFIEDEDFFDKYITSWQKISPEKYLNNFVNDRLDSNYSGGVFLSPSQVEQLIDDYNKDKNTKTILDSIFSHGRIEIFLEALNFAKNKKMGLIEATEVVEPHPNINIEPTCYCNLFNCDFRGIGLFQAAAMQQIQKTLDQNA